MSVTLDIGIHVAKFKKRFGVKSSICAEILK